LIRKFQPAEVDISWASHGVVANVRDGEAIPLTQNRIWDAGFDFLKILPMGADKVFIFTTLDTEVMTVINGARDFFNMLFENFKPWNNDKASFQRGAWVRIYGIPLHAWNESFFKLCVMDCGRYLRSDGASIDKERLDFARVLLSTFSVEIINVVDNILVGDTLVELKIIEEWGFNLGEDVCQFEEDDMSVTSHADHEEVARGEDVENAVDLIVEKLEEEVGEAEGCNVNVEEACSKDESSVLSPVLLKEKNVNDSLKHVETEPVFNGPLTKAAEGVSSTARIGRTLSCPPGRGRMASSGPWSIEWMNDHFDEEAGIVFSSKKKKARSFKSKSVGGQGVVSVNKKRKNGGIVQHSTFSLKKVARLPCKDRKEALKILRKKVRKRSERSVSCGVVGVETHPTSSNNSSSASINNNNDWQHWVVMHGNEKVAVDDVWGMGKAIGVEFNGDPANMFNVLSRVGRGKKVVGEGLKGGGLGEVA